MAKSLFQNVAAKMGLDAEIGQLTFRDLHHTVPPAAENNLNGRFLDVR
jgi:hypothetical protein